MNDTIIKFLKASEASRISLRGYKWLCWSKSHHCWAVYVHRGADDAPGDLVYLTDDISAALDKLYGAEGLPALGE